jgi:hypothetical protein
MQAYIFAIAGQATAEEPVPLLTVALGNPSPSLLLSSSGDNITAASSGVMGGG